MTLVEVENWPGGGPMLREQKAALGKCGVFTKGKGWWPDPKGSDGEERDDVGKWGWKERNWRSVTTKEEKAKPGGKGTKEFKEVEGKENEGDVVDEG